MDLNSVPFEAYAGTQFRWIIHDQNSTLRLSRQIIQDMTHFTYILEQIQTKEKKKLPFIYVDAF